MTVQLMYKEFFGYSKKEGNYFFISTDTFRSLQTVDSSRCSKKKKFKELSREVNFFYNIQGKIYKMCSTLIGYQ